MTTNTSPQPWVEGDRSHRDTAKVVSDSTDRILMSDVDFARAQPRLKPTDDARTQPDHIELASIFNTSGDSHVQKLESLALKYYQSQDPKIFEVKSGRFAGMQVPEYLRCAIFQSNLAVQAGLIKPGEVTVRAIEFGNLMKSKGYSEETFVPGKSYPNGTYIVGAGGGSNGERNHVGLVLNGKLLHTQAGGINYESIGNKFKRGAYDEMHVYIPPKSNASRSI